MGYGKLKTGVNKSGLTPKISYDVEMFLGKIHCIKDSMIKITPQIGLDESELEYAFIRASGPGGQNVNKVATAVQLRFNIRASLSFSEVIRKRLLKVLNHKLTQEGELIIKANRYRTQEQNKRDALTRLCKLLKDAAILPKKRKMTKPTLASVERRIQKKKYRSRVKLLRQKSEGSDPTY